MSVMRRLLTAGCLAAGACALTVAAAPEPGYAQPPGKKDKDDKGPKMKDGPKEREGPKHVADLRKAYDLLTEAAALTRPDGKKKDKERDGPAADGRRYFEAAKRVYREAVTANADDGPPNPEQAAAAADAARGLRDWLRASLPADPGLPRPPAGPREADSLDPIRTDLRRVKDRLDDPSDGGPAAREFRDAARRVYAEARAAYEDKDYGRAAGLARAADAWLRVGDHLSRRDEPAPPPRDRKDRDRPEPKGKKDRGPPPPVE